MSNRTVKHSSRYTGPAGDSRPSAEIFAGMEARAVESKYFSDALMDAFDAIWNGAKLSSPESRISIVWETAVKWRMKHDIEFAESIDGVGRIGG